MRSDEFNSVPVRNETGEFSRIEFGSFQKAEYTFYNDNKSDIKDEINDQKHANHENVDTEKGNELLEKEISKVSEGTTTSSTSSESVSTGSSSVTTSASTSAASGASAAGGVASTAVATVGAVVIAVPTIIAIALTTNVKTHEFIATSNEISYFVDLDVDKEDTRTFGIYLSSPILEYYQTQELTSGPNEGVFTNLSSETEYKITVLAYEQEENKDIEPQGLVRSIRNIRETYTVEELPEGDVLYSEVIKTLKEEKPVSALEIGGEIKEMYQLNEGLDISQLEVYAIYVDESMELIPNDELSIIYDFSTPGDKEITITYKGVSSTIEVYVQDAKKVARLEVTSEEHEVSYYVGDEFNTELLEVTAYYTDTTYNPEIIDNSLLEFEYDFSRIGETSVIISYEGVEAILEVHIYPHVDISFELEADFRTYEMPVGITNIFDMEKVTGISLIIDNESDLTFELDVEEGNQVITLPNEDYFDYEGEHTFRFAYFLNNDTTNLITALEVTGSLNNTHVDVSELTGFTLGSVIDKTYGEDYNGTETISYSINYVDDLGVFSDFHLKISTSEDMVGNNETTFTYEYDLTPNYSGKGIIDLMNDELSGSQMTDDILVGRTFYTQLSYIDSRISDPVVLNGDNVRFETNLVTSVSVDVLNQYRIEDDAYIIPIKITHHGFDAEGLDGFKLYCYDTNDKVNEYASSMINDFESGSNAEFVIPISGLENSNIDINNMFIEIELNYYNHTFVIYEGEHSFRNTQAVYGDTSFLSSYSKFDDGLVYVKLDYSDPNNQYQDFRLTLSYNETFAETTHYSYDFALEKTLNRQSVDTTKPLGDETFTLQGRQYNYAISYYDNVSKSYVTAKSGVILFDTFTATFDDYYSSSTRSFQFQLIHTTSNTFSDIYLTLTSQKDPDMTHTWTLANTEEYQPISIYEAEQYSDVVWDFENNTFDYVISARQLKIDGSADDYEVVEYLVGTVSFEVVPKLELLQLEKPYKKAADNISTTEDSYYLPLCIDVTDPNKEIGLLTLVFGEDDGDYNTPVDVNSVGWGDITEINFDKEFTLYEGEGYFPNGYRQIDITTLLSPLFGNNLISEGDTIKYSLIASIDSDSVVMQTGAYAINFEGNEVFGVSPSIGVLLSGQTTFDVSISFNNNATDSENSLVAGVDYIALSTGDGDYFIPVNWDINTINESFTIDLANAYIAEPNEIAAAGEDLGDPIGQEAANELITNITSNKLSCTFNVYYHLYNSTELLKTTNGHIVYFELTA